MFLFLELISRSNDQFMGLILVYNTSSISFVFMVIAQMLSLYHCTRYHFLNICRNIKHIVFFGLLLLKTLWSVYGSVGKTMLCLTFSIYVEA